MINGQEFREKMPEGINANAALNKQREEFNEIDINQNALMPEMIDHSAFKVRDVTHEELAKQAKIINLSEIEARKKKYRSNRSKAQIRENSVQWMDLKSKNEEGTKKSQIADSELVRNNSELLLRDKKWTRFFFASESPEMIAVKESVAYLNNILDEDVKTKNGIVDVSYLLETVLPAYQTAFAACDKYVTKRNSEGKKKGYGKRRLDKVTNMLHSLQKEMNEMKLVVDNIQNSQKVGFKENTDYLTDTIMESKQMSVRHLLGEVVRRKAIVCAFVPEGNSSNTYRVKLEGSDGKVYYVKKEEPLLNENLPGYLDNRLAELNRSKEIKENNKKAGKGPDHIKRLDERIADLNKKVEAKEMNEVAADKEIIQIRAQREELRLENILDMKDYEYGIQILNTMKEKIDAATGDAKSEQIQRYIQFFAHDFDGFFSRMNETNAKVRMLIDDGGQIDTLIATLEKDKPKGWKQQVQDLEKVKAKGLKEMTELEWIEAHKKDLGIEGRNGEELMTILREMGEDKNDAHRISKFFQRTTGKEAELFGQQSSRSGTSGSDVLASNNTSTSRLARKYGFDDVVTNSFKGKLDMTEVGQTKTVVNNVTFSEAAQGEELLQIVQDAQKLQKEKGIEEPIVHFSPEAIRDLSRMHTFDLSTAQTDRHWRNIKSEVKKKTGKDKKPVWIIGKSMCYDHDQSHGIKDLKEYFKDIKDDKTGETKTVGEGFLKPIMMTVSKNSAIYKYAVQNKMTKENEMPATQLGYRNLLDSIPMPKSKTASLDNATKRYKANNKTDKDQYTHFPDNMTQRIISKFWWEKDLHGDDAMFANGPAEADYAETQTEVIKAMNKRNPGMEKQSLEFFKLMYKLSIATSRSKGGGYYDVTDEFLFSSQAEMDKAKSKMKTRAEKDKCMLRKDFIKDLKTLTELYNTLDFTYLEDDMKQYAPQSFSGDSHVVGYYDYTFQSVLHLFKLKLQAEPGKTNDAINELAKEEAESKRKKISEQIQAEDKKKNINRSKADREAEVDKRIKEEQEDTVRVPSILHMDKEAYYSIKRALEKPEELDTLLIDLDLTKDKKDALKRRLQQIIDDADEACKIVNKWADMKGLPKEAIERKFLLEKDDYAKIKKLTDMALDPGQSYFSVEDSQFMVSNPMMNRYLGTKDREMAKKITNEERTTRRQKMGALDANEKYTSYVSNSIAS